jgi:hypothetical protein
MSLSYKSIQAGNLEVNFTHISKAPAVDKKPPTFAIFDNLW